MSTTRSEAAGVLVFDGPARITPVIDILFCPFVRDQWSGARNYERTIVVADATSALLWTAYADYLAGLLFSRFGIYLDRSDDPKHVLGVLAQELHLDFDTLLDAIDFKEDVTVLVVFRLAMRLKDGHNLIGLTLEGARYGGKRELGAIGGSAIHATPRCCVSMTSSDVIDFARRWDLALTQGAVAASEELNQWIDRFVDEVSDPSLRNSLKRLYGLPVATCPDSVSSKQIWSRNVYVSARSTDVDGTPRFAHLIVTPQFTELLWKLQQHCKKFGLTQVRHKLELVAWGSPQWQEDHPVEAQNLVVTPGLFWFSARTFGIGYKVETAHFALMSFLDQVTGPGTPLFFGLPASEIGEPSPIST